MLPYTPLVYVVYVDIGVEINALLLPNVTRVDPGKYSESNVRHERNAAA